MKIVNPLTWREVNALKKPGLFSVGGAVGLYLLVRPQGQRYYVYRFKAKDGKRSMISLGSFNEVDLSEARLLAGEWKKRLRSGDNPSIVRKNEAAERKRVVEAELEKFQEELRTFKFVAELWLQEQRKGNFWAKNDRGETHAVHFLKNYLYPAFENKPMSEINVHDVFEMIRPHYQHHYSTSNKILSLCSSIWEWAEVKGWTSGSNPAKKSGSLKVLLSAYRNDRDLGKNYAALPIEDIPEFFEWLHKLDGPSVDLTEFQILTACRSKMARLIKWEHVDFEAGTVLIPESSLKTKNRGDHTVFLSIQAMRLLKSQPRVGEYVFSNSKAKPFSDAACGVVLKRLDELRQAAGKLSFIDKDQTKKEGRIVTPTLHGTARATFKTWTKTGENRELLDEEAVEMCLAHGLKDDYDGAYNRAHLSDERREVMQMWADYCHTNIPF